ncbi:hypothetical protein [Rhizobium laguerreae]|uniref:hypothetical protein n=1 Tax=Rhizobium laguerreae TaxID=1076926 RepID=UPI001C91599F|nr:hypothetical protein [Rhizobium laguerreae]MBY3138987.1 hypothetical protein [Rhizobium laguerreae]
MKTIIAIGSAGLLLSSCVSLLDNNIDHSGTITAISNEIECELKDAFPPVDLKSKHVPEHWTVTYAITENIKDSRGIGLNPLTWITAAHVDKFELGVGASLSNETERNAKATFSLDLYQTGEVACDPASTRKNRFQFKSWAHQVLGKTPSRPGKLASFGYTIRVTTIGSAQIDPDFADGRGVATAALGAGREAMETVDFGFSKYSPPQDQRVFVTNFPQGVAIPKSDTRLRVRGITSPPQPFGIPEENLRLNRETIQQLQLDRIDR